MSDLSITTTCSKCSKVFSTKSSLNYHKKTSQSCKENNEKHVCNYCSRELATVNNLQRHELICPEKQKKEEKENLENMEKTISYLEQEKKEYEKDLEYKDRQLEYIKKENLKNIEKTNNSLDKERKKYEKELELIKKEYEKDLKYKDMLLEEKNKQIEAQEKQYQKQIETQEKQIQELQDKLQDLAKIAIDKKSTSNTTTTNIIHGGDLNLYMNKEEIHETIMSKLTKDSIYTGFNGVAKFVVNYIAKINGKQVYFCVDVSRLIFRFHDDKGNEIKDPKAIKILNMLKPSIEQKLYKIREEENTECERLKTLSPANQERIDKLPMCEFTLDKVSKLIFEVFDMLNNNKMASEMAKLLS